jgi:hypothetical protein
MAKELSHRDWIQEKVKDLEFSLLGVADITEINGFSPLLQLFRFNES